MKQILTEREVLVHYTQIRHHKAIYKLETLGRDAVLRLALNMEVRGWTKQMLLAIGFEHSPTILTGLPYYLAAIRARIDMMPVLLLEENPIIMESLTEDQKIEANRLLDQLYDCRSPIQVQTILMKIGGLPNAMMLINNGIKTYAEMGYGGLNHDGKTKTRL